MQTNNADQRLEALDVTLPAPPQPLGVYRPFLRVGPHVYVSGHGTLKADGTFITGKVGRDMDKEEAKRAARQVGLAMLATLKANLGSLNKIRRVIKVLGMVNATEDFEQHPFVINGFSELLVEIFGEENGVGVRSAVGMSSLPDGIPVEIEAVFELDLASAP